MLQENTDIIATIIASSLVMGFLIVFIIIGTLLYNNRQKFFAQEQKLTKQKHENQIINIQLEIGKETTEKISRELHDNIGQKLSAAKLMIGHLDVSSEHEEVGHILGDVISDVRNLSRALKTESKLKDGLIASLEYQATLLSKSGDIEVETDFKDEPDLTELENLTIYRICQECIQNIVKHSKATNVWIETSNEPSFSFSVRDNGIGLDKEKLSFGAGLDNIEERCTQINYEFSIESTLESGTTITIKKNPHEQHS